MGKDFAASGRLGMSRRWCSQCQAEREGSHRHGDPLELLTREELLELVRGLTDPAQIPEPTSFTPAPSVPLC